MQQNSFPGDADDLHRCKDDGGCRMQENNGMQELMHQNNETRGTMVSLKDQRYTYARRIPHSLFGLQTSKQAKLNTDVVLECTAERRQRFMVQKFEEKIKLFRAKHCTNAGP